MPAKLNRGRQFGTVNPPMNGCFYYQDGKHFDADGYEADLATGKRLADASQPAAPPKPAKMLTVDPPIIVKDEEQRDEGEGEQPKVETVVDFDAPIDPVSRAGFELWANDPDAYKKLDGAPETWNDLKAAFSKAYGQDFPSKKLWQKYILENIVSA